MIAKSEILFLYESIFSMPNGDPFTGEQRYDEETKRIRECKIFCVNGHRPVELMLCYWRRYDQRINCYQS